MSPRGLILAAALTVVCGMSALASGADDGESPRLSAAMPSATGRVGDPLELVLTLELPEGYRLASADVGPDLGEFRVLGGGWQPSEEGRPLTWRGTVAAYRTGELEFPALELRVRGGGGIVKVRSEPLEVTIESVLDEGAGDRELAGIKPPVSTARDFSALRLALGIVGALLAASLLVWWLVRRYGGRFAARPVPDDPFNRMPPHEWVYGALRELIERRLPEQDRVEEFYSELARILKRYLSGRYRVELLERTTAEVAPALQQCGAPAEPTRWLLDLLQRSDRVKFARQIPSGDDCRSEVEQAYLIVDHTRPAAEPSESLDEGAA